MMFFGDPLYTVVMLVGMVLVFVPQQWVMRTYRKYSEHRASRGMTGAQVAEGILRENGLFDVRVESVAGVLSDHYDPTSRTIRLSEAIYHGQSIAGAAVAAHECGHALQHAKGFVPVVIRSAMVPAVNLGSSLGPILIMISLGMGFTGLMMPDWALTLAWVGVALFGMAVAFHVVTLPVELDASARALKILAGSYYLSAEEMPAARKVLTAAAFTYVATALYALIQLLYFVMQILGRSRND